MTTMLGYSSILGFTLSCYVVGISIPIIADDVFPNQLPKIVVWNAYFIYALPAPIWVYVYYVSSSYCSLVKGIKIEVLLLLL